MSRKRHKSRNSNEVNNNINNKQYYNSNPFGINPNQLLSMFSNIDMSQINSMLQSMNTDGFDFNNFNLGSLQNIMSGIGGTQNQPQQTVKNNTDMSSNKQKDKKGNSNYEDENIQMLLSLKKIVNEERVAFIDKILKLYEEGVFEE